jgi:transposase-like protein
MMTFQEFMRTYPDEAACRTYLMICRWPDGPHCPRCDNTKVYECGPKRPFHWQCMKCGPSKRTPYRFSVLVGTVFENTNVPLLTWFKVLYTMLQSLKGVSSRQVRRMFLGERSSLHTAWYVCHRLRAGMRDDDFKKLMGIVEVDETALSGKDKNRHWDKKQHITGMSGKTMVIGAISRKGNVVCQIIENTDAKTLNRYVRGEVHTNNIESFWSLLTRGIVGTYHNVSKKYLPLYLNEFQFRHNHRKDADIFGSAMAGC